MANWTLVQTLNIMFWSSEEYAHAILPDAKKREAFGCENDRQKLGTDEKNLLGNFSVEQIKKSCSIYKPTGISVNFL